VLGGIDTEETLEIADDIVTAPTTASASGFLTAVKIGTALGAGGLGVWAALTLIQIYPLPEEKSSTKEVTLARPEAPVITAQKTSLPKHREAQEAPSEAPAAKSVKNQKLKLSYVLDKYPESVRASLLDTSRGIMGDPSQISSEPSKPIESQKPTEQDGNFYKLLEKAGSDKPDASPPDEPSWETTDSSGSWSPPDSSESAEYNPSEEEERREAIRQKFLEAIRAAAERREQEGMDQ
jgi:hypothetical protein